MLTLFIRVVVLYSVLFTLLRLMGKRQLAELEPFEFVITLIIANLTVTPMSDTGVPLIYGLVPILALFLLQQFVSFISLKSDRIRACISGKPNILIMHGNICEQEMRKLRYTLSDLSEQLRAKDVTSVAEVEYAILETSGDLSVIRKAEYNHVTLQDLQLPIQKSTLPLMVVLDGNLHRSALTMAGRNEQWLQSKLQALGFTDVRRVFYACLDGDKLHVQGKGNGATMRTLTLAKDAS